MDQRRLIAKWTDKQDPETDAPVRVMWEDRSPATMADFDRIISSTQSYPDVYADGSVEFSYEVEKVTESAATKEK